MTLPIATHRLLSDGHSVALMQPDATVDWWCAPYMDSSPVLWSLLDQRGASARWGEVRAVAVSGWPAGGTARTTLRQAGGGRLECWDGLWHGASTALIRLVRALDGDLDVVHELTLGGFDGPWARWSGGEATVGDWRVVVRGGVSRVDCDGMLLRSRLVAPRGAWAGLLVSFDSDRTAETSALRKALEEIERGQAALRRRALLSRHHPERSADALAVLRACTFLPTGAVIASPTTSLPEAVGGDRQFDYRFTWFRDASLAVSVAALLGDREGAQRYLQFLNRHLNGRPPRAPLCDIRGGAVPPEREVPGVEGWKGSRPVRVGNDAADQVQDDMLGLIVEAISVYVQQGGRLDDETWTLVKAIADEVAGERPGRTNGIWEFRDQRPLVSADIGRWLALDRAIWIARGWRPFTPRRRWKRARREIRERVLAAIQPNGGLPQQYGGPPDADASALMAVIFRLLDRRDPRAPRLLDATIHALEADGLLYRYEPGDSKDGFAGTEGAFLPASWWAVSALAALGRVDEARQRADVLCAALPRLLPEEIEPFSREGRGNVPLVWSHIEVARAMYLLDAARLRERYGAFGLGLWRVGRYAWMTWCVKTSNKAPHDDGSTLARGGCQRVSAG